MATAKKLPAFTLAEVLVSLLLIALSVTAALSAISYSNRSAVSVSKLSGLENAAVSYFSKLAVTRDLKSELFNEQEINRLKQTRVFPAVFPEKILSEDGSGSLVLNREVIRPEPLLVKLQMYRLEKSGKTLKKDGYFLETVCSEWLSENFE